MSDESARVGEPPHQAWVVAMLSLPHIGPRRMHELSQLGDPQDTWERIRAGTVRLELAPNLRDEIVRESRLIDVKTLWQRHIDLGVQVLLPSDSDYPAMLQDDPEPPAALFCLGNLDTLNAPTVAIVGTRTCSVYGRTVATELGRMLAEVGVCVISGLALGIDAAAHAGAVSSLSNSTGDARDGAAPPAAVVAAGLESPSPLANRGLFRRIAADGVVLSEAPVGAPGARWRFPARNRIIAALAQAVVVVESPPSGGSMYTVDEALRRDRLVFAVPGSIHNPMSKGTNRLLAEGALPYTEFADILTAIGHTGSPEQRTTRVTLSADGQLLLDHLDYEPEMVDDLILSTGLSVSRAIAALDELLRAGLVMRQGAVVHRLADGAADGNDNMH